jgi:hypothetical protein
MRTPRLLEDLSETHVILTDWPVPPTVEACERIVDTWAMFHGFWWRTRAGRDVGTFFDTAALAQITADYRGRYERFAVRGAHRAIEQRVNDGTLWHDAAVALSRHLCQHALDLSEVRDLPPDLVQVVDRHATATPLATRLRDHRSLPRPLGCSRPSRTHRRGRTAGLGGETPPSSI